MIRSLWYVDTPDDSTLTVIAESHGDALDFAIEFCGYGERFEYNATRAGPSDDGSRRWVGFEDDADAGAMVHELDAHGVTSDRVRIRTTAQPGVGPLFFEVGARDEDWCRLPAGVLCGGEE